MPASCRFSFQFVNLAPLNPKSSSKHMIKTIGTIFCSALLLFASCKSALLEGDTKYNNMEYYEALDSYRKASEGKLTKAEKAEVIYKQALCYMMFNDTKKAETWFAKAIKAKYTDPAAILYLAEMLKKNGKYDEALAKFDEYVKIKPDDARGTRGSESCKLAVKWKENPTKHKVDNVQPLNTKFDDFSAIYTRKGFKEIIFTSSREGSSGSGTDGWTGQAFSDLYEAKVDKNGKWSTPTQLKEPVNTKYNDGAASLNAKFAVMFFTRCSADKNKVKGCQIYTTKKKGNTWDEPVLISFAADSFTVGHPWINDDETLLFFASDMPGGFGGRDVWMAKYNKKGKSWDNPVNLGPQVNTPGDELYPTLRNDSILFFSSNGHVGMGGLDIFEAKLKDGKWGGVANMKFPINSHGDDFSIIFQGKAEKGLLTSTREGGKGNADIYEFTVPPILFTLSGIVYDIETKKPVTGAKVTMVDKDGMNQEITTDQTGSYYFDNTKFKEDNTYNLTVTAPDYLGDKGAETTVGENTSKDFKHDFNLKPVRKEMAIRLPQILYDLDKADLRPESRDSLNGLIQTLRDNQNITIELMSHTDARGTSKSNIDLSQRRAQSVVDYLISQKIDPARLKAKGYGETKLLNKCKDGVKCTEEEHQVNRRTEFRILSFDFVPAQGSPEFKAPTIETVGEDEEVETDVQEQQRENIKIETPQAPQTPQQPQPPKPKK